MTLFTYRAYTGIGSRETPDDIKTFMTILAFALARDGWILRSGCAPGADSAFEAGAKAALKFEGVTKPELYLPWPEFEGRVSGLARKQPQEEAFPIAAQFHPNWGNLTDGGRKLHARNVHQVLGHDVTAPQLSTFVLCWTPEGRGGGGTGQALRIAKAYDVKEIYDLAKPKDMDKMVEYLDTLMPVDLPADK